MRAEIISVGTELLLGFIVDTNAAYLAQQLAAQGIDLYYVSVFGDNLDRLAEGVKRAFDRSDLVIFTGGLGPTEDDLTRDAIGKALGETLFVDPDLEQQQIAFWRSRNIPMPPRNLTQAQLIPSAQALPNPIGSAPGWWVESNGTIAVAMPGVPREMFRMWEQEALPRLRQRGIGGIIMTRTLKILGRGESAVEQAVSEFLKSPNPTIATYAKNDGVHLRLSAKAADPARAASMLREFEEHVRPLVDADVYAVDDETLGTVLARLLDGRQFAVADSLTGGGLAANLIDSPELAELFAGGVGGAETRNDWTAKFGVPGRAETAQALALHARELFGAPVGIGLSGVPGPAGIDGVKPGTFAIAVDGGVSTSQQAFRATTPAEVRRWAIYSSLNVIWRTLSGRNF